MKLVLFFLTLLFLLPSCNKGDSQDGADWEEENPKIPQAVPYKMDSPSILIKNVKLYTANGPIYQKANLLMAKGRIRQISENPIAVGEKVQVIDGAGLVLTPGLIDVHSHMGVFSFPHVDAHSDGNEMTRPITSDVWAEHGFWPQDPNLWRALAGGVTTIQVLPGSGNLIGGRSFTAKLLPQLSAREMRFDGAAQGLKMACGENPKRVYKEKSLMTRMGNVGAYRKVFQEALEYRREWKTFADKGGEKLPKRNLVLETLVGVLKGDILLHFHCYRADDISAILDVANEFGFKIRTVHHGLGAYKIAPRLAKEDTAVATWADWWGFKAEAFDGIPQNAALVHKAGGRAIIHSDSPVDVRTLNVEAGKAMVSGGKIGISISEDQALAWITKNPAWALGLEKEIGTLQVGKMADMVLWDGHPFSILTKSKMVFINGQVAYDRDQNLRPESDFEVGFDLGGPRDGRDFQPPETKVQMNFVTRPLEDISKESPSGNFKISNVSIFFRGKWLNDQTALVTDGKISIGSQGKKDIPTIDGKGRFLTPTFTQASGNVGLMGIELDSSAQDLWQKESISPDSWAVDSLNLNTIRIPIYRHEGVGQMIAHPAGGMIAGHGVGFQTSANSPLVSPIALFGSLNRGRGDKSLSRSEMWSAFRSLVEDALYYRNHRADYDRGQSRPLSLSKRHLEAMLPALAGKVPFVVKAHRADDIARLVAYQDQVNAKSGVALRIVIHGGAESWKVADLLARKKIPVIVAPSSSQGPSSFSQIHSRSDLSAFLNDKKVPLIINDEGDLGAPRLRQEAGFAVKYGLPEEAALKAISETPAQVFGLSGGVLKAGSPASMVLWSGNPLEPTSRAEFYWSNGKPVSLFNRQLLLAKKYLKKNSE